MKILAGVSLFVFLLLAIIGAGENRKMAASLTLEESLDHPNRATRYWYRFWKWSGHYALALLVVGSVAVQLGRAFLPRTEEGYAGSLTTVPWALPAILIAAIPVAALFHLLYRGLARSGDRLKRGARRRMGRPGYTVLPSAVVQAQAKAVRMIATPTAATGTVRKGMDEALETGDPELIREVARKHWEALNFAIASNGDRRAAHALQEIFLNKLDKLPDETLADAMREAYIQESALQVQTATRLMNRQSEITAEQAATRKRVSRNLMLLAAICCAVWLLSRLLH